MNGKCDNHGVDYQTEWQESCCKTVQFCPECRKEESDRLMKFFQPQPPVRWPVQRTTEREA